MKKILVTVLMAILMVPWNRVDAKPIEPEIRLYDADGTSMTLQEMRLIELKNQEHSCMDIYWLYKCVEAEESGNTKRAKYLTACCILNRVNVKWNGKETISDVIFDPYQFAVTRNGMIYAAKPTQETIDACNEALANNTAPWCLAFSYGNRHSRWATVVEIHGLEHYYKLRYD